MVIPNLGRLMSAALSQAKELTDSKQCGGRLGSTFIADTIKHVLQNKTRVNLTHGKKLKESKIIVTR